jgi:hypothetical protein
MVLRLPKKAKKMPRMTIADFLDGVITDWRKFFRLVIILFATGLAVAISVRFLVWLATNSGLQPTSIELSSEPKIILERTHDDQHEVLLVVQPQGWMDSGVPVAPGDLIQFHAQGSINITSSSLQDQTQVRRRIEDRLLAKKRRGAFGNIPDSLWLPERHYLPTDHDSLRLAAPRGWMGPDGDIGPNGMRDSRYPARARNRILPSAPYGMLVAAVSQRQPMRYDNFSGAFRIGASRSVKWTGDPGTLWLNVNDVWDDDDGHFPEKFYVDNIGFFLVRVIVKRE